jgi:hypothetical protein
VSSLIFSLSSRCHHFVSTSSPIYTFTFVLVSSTYTFPDGSLYDGEWRDNTPNGWGVFRWPDNSVFQGMWKDGRRHGNSGILIVSDGFRYEGAWVENAMEGRGVATVSRLS